MQGVINPIWATEMRLLEPICTFTKYDGYDVFRSDLFPTYYGGNGLLLHEPARKSLSEWEETFHQHFDPEIFEHFFFTCDFAHAPESFEADAEERGYDETSPMVGVLIEDETSLVEDNDAHEIRLIESAEDWAELLRFDMDSSREEKWFTEKACRELFEKSKHVSEAVGIDWFGLYDRGGQEIVAKLGIFKHGALARLQDVATAEHRRREGLASELVSFAARRALRNLGAEGLAICADVNYHALGLYRKLGGRDAIKQVYLMKFGKRRD